ncbi:hypothetical protein ACQYAD_11740 [Neobacillus sp. SM06]|uniref:hypothetical protein n=1 Tax=Neobacillus sp. SM06 TaxID=3422492 RepID=UPI003D2E2B61
MNRLNKNSFPFLILFVFHSVLMVYSFYKSKNKKKLFILLMSNIGLAYVFEYVILNVLHAYKYKPKVFRVKELDNVFGGILSQAIFVPFTAIFLTSNQYGWKAKTLFTAYFALIENLFIKLDVYRHQWWLTIYSFLLFPFYFQLSDFWYNQLQKGKPLIRFLSLFFMTFVSGINLLFALSVNRKFKFGRGRYYSWSEHFVIAPIYTFLLSFLSTFLFSRKNNCASWLLMLAISTSIEKIMIKLKILKSKLQRRFISQILHVLMIVLIAIFRKWIYAQEEKSYYNGKE